MAHVLGKSVAGDVYSMTLGIRVCLLFQKVSLQNRSYLFKKKKLLWLNQEKTVFCNYFFSTYFMFVFCFFLFPSCFMRLVN